MFAGGRAVFDSLVLTSLFLNPHPRSEDILGREGGEGERESGERKIDVKETH